MNERCDVFVTVGTQGPFDRLVRAVDAWAAERRAFDVFAQIGRGAAPPEHVRFAESVTPAAFLAHLRSARAIVAHAGMGTIITALEHGKPILILPRRAALGEQRNDHQIATAKRFQELGRAAVAFEPEEVPSLLDAILAGDGPAAGIAPPSPELLRTIANFINSPARRDGAH